MKCLAKTKLVDKNIRWKEGYTDKTSFLRKQFNEIVGPGSYFRYEGEDIDTGAEYYCILSPAKIHNPIAKFFAGVRKLPATYSAGGKYFDSLSSAAQYAHDTWGVPIPNEMRTYTSASLYGISDKVDKWKAENKHKKEKEEKREERKEKREKEKEEEETHEPEVKKSILEPQIIVEDVEGKSAIKDEIEKVADSKVNKHFLSSLSSLSKIGVKEGVVESKEIITKVGKELVSYTLKNLIKIARELDNDGQYRAAEEVHKVIRKYHRRLL